ncbi:hypothetical protein Lser_V15G18710 [Lactuca serriola]
MVDFPYNSWIVIIEDVKYKVNENQFYGLVLSKLISWGNLVSYGDLKDDNGCLLFQPLCKIVWLNKIALSILVRSRNQNEGEERDLFNKKYISLIENPNDVHALKFVEVLDNGVQCDVLDVQEKGVQVDSNNEKVFCSIGVQTDDILSSCDLFEGMIPYRKPVIQEIHNYQTPKDFIQIHNVHVVESGFVHEIKSSRCKKMRKKKNKKINQKNKRVYSQKWSNVVVRPKSVKQIWVPKQQSPKDAFNLKSKPKSVGGSFEDVLGSLKNTKNTKNELYISHGGWYNVRFGDFLIPTKEPRSCKFDSFVENGSRFVKKVSQILKWMPKHP